MSFSAIFRRLRRGGAPAAAAEPEVVDLAFLRRLDRLALRTAPTLRGHGVGQRASWRRLPSSDFREHRLYLPGDDLRHVDWNASARSEHVFIKQGERPREVAIHLLVDNTASMDWGKPSKWWAARRLAAALGYVALNHGDRVALEALGGGAARFGPTHGKGRVPGLLRVVRELALTRQADLPGALGSYAARHPRGGLALVISDFLSVESLEPVLEAMRAPAWQLLLLHLLHPAELDPTLRGEIEFWDVETRERANYDLDARALERYRGHVREWCEALEQQCFARGAAYARVLADWPIEQAMMPYLRRRRVVVAA